MHLLYRLTSFCIPVEKKLFGSSCVRDVDGRPERPSSLTRLTQFEPFHPLINLSLTPGALSILSQQMTVNFHRFHSFCPKKPHYATLFFDGAILQRSVHVFALVAATRLKAEGCTAHGWTLQQALSILRNAPAPFSPGYRVFKNCLYFLIHPRTYNCDWIKN